MNTEKLKPHQLFDDLAEKQRVIKINSKKVSLEEARALTKWIKDGKVNKKERPIVGREKERQTTSEE